MKTTAAIALALALVSSGCAGNQVEVDSQTDRWTDFSKFQTFSFKPDSSGIANPITDSEVKNSIGAKLAAKGYRKAAGPADLTVHYYVGLESKANVRHTRFVYRGRYVAAAGRKTTVDAYRQGRLYVDVYDTATMKLVWRATADGTARDRDEGRRKTAAALERIMSSFPSRKN